MYLLELRNVSVKVEECRKEGGTLLHDVSFGIKHGEIAAIVGESGSGKSTLLRAVGALSSPGNGISINGRILFEGEDIVSADPERLQRLRQGPMRYIFQEPAMAFNPMSRIGSQMQTLIGKDRYDEEILISQLMELDLNDPAEALQSYPHQLSTGMMQRISIVLALFNSPALVLADEPTSAVDIIHRSVILRILQERCRLNKMGVLLSTHDLRIAERYADSVIVLYAGRVVEQSPVQSFFKLPLHPYSQFLLEKMPPAHADILPGGDGTGQMPENDSTRGCRFQSSCPIVQEMCRVKEPDLIPSTQDRRVRCHFSK